MFEIGVLGFGGENEVVEKVFSFRNKVYLLSRCYFIILNIKYIYIYISKENPLNSQKLLLR